MQISNRIHGQLDSEIFEIHSLAMLQQNETPLLLPDVLVCSVGTEILHNTGKGYVADAQWEAKLDEGWDASVAAEIGEEFDNLELQVGTTETVNFHCL